MKRTVKFIITVEVDDAVPQAAELVAAYFSALEGDLTTLLEDDWEYAANEVGLDDCPDNEVWLTREDVEG
jgi:hypothetical protein